MILLNKFINDSSEPKVLHKICVFNNFNEGIDLKYYRIIKNKYAYQHLYYFNRSFVTKYVYLHLGNDIISIAYDSNYSVSYYSRCVKREINMSAARVKTYYRFFYDMKCEDFKKRKTELYQQVVWPVYKLPIAIQNPYV